MRYVSVTYIERKQQKELHDTIMRAHELVIFTFTKYDYELNIPIRHGLHTNIKFYREKNRPISFIFKSQLK